VAMPAPAERVVRWRRGTDNPPPKPVTKPPIAALPRAPALAAAAPHASLPSVGWGQSCASK
jgi:hypothetical protein